MRKYGIFLVLALVAFVMFEDAAWAQQTEGLPYEDWLIKVKTSVTGPVAMVLSLVGLVGAGAMLIFGGEISTFLKSLVYIVLVTSFLVGAGTIYTKLFGGTDGYNLKMPVVAHVYDLDGNVETVRDGV